MSMAVFSPPLASRATKFKNRIKTIPLYPGFPLTAASQGRLFFIIKSKVYSPIPRQMLPLQGVRLQRNHRWHVSPLVFAWMKIISIISDIRLTRTICISFLVR
jgi:hypothetical protein